MSALPPPADLQNAASEHGGAAAAFDDHRLEHGLDDRLREGMFERGFAPWAAPTAAGAPAVPEPLITWQPLLPDVTGVQIRGWIAGQGWFPAAALTARPGTTPVSGIVTGLELAVERAGGDRIVRVFLVKD